VVDDVDDGPLAAEEAAKAKDAATSTQGDRTQAEGGPDKSPLPPTHEGSTPQSNGPPAHEAQEASQAVAVDADRSTAHQSLPWDGTVPDGEQGAITPPVNRPERTTPSPPKDTASAQRRFKSFAVKVKRPKPAALLKRPSPVKAAETPKKRPTRSWRIAAQSLSRIPASKRGEYLVLKRLGHASPLSASTARNKFDALFGNNPEDDEALRELFPDDGHIGGRRRRRRARA